MKKHYLISFLLLLSILFFGGCSAHSWGGKRITTDPSTAASGPLQTGRAMYVAILQPVAEDLADSPEYIAAQFAKNLSAVAGAVETGVMAGSIAEGLAASRAAAADYLVLLQIHTWKMSSLLSPGHKTSVEILVIDTGTEKICDRSTIEANCYVMVAGLEQSPRECIRPQVVAWMEKTFDAKVESKPQTDLKTLEMMR